ncbi:MAG TPA: hypothetical protein VJ843_00055 [Candidatus Saccharimonadales bacterium]|nr:hypothetical protein [Candidatus Saccharimonadales bacterium]
MNEKVYKLIEEEINDLITIGERLLELARKSDNGLGAEHISQATTWVSRSGQLLKRLYDRDSQHVESFQRVISKYDFTNLHGNYYVHLCEVIGILKAIQHELKRGLIVDLKKLLQASIFADFLEMAEYLLSEGYKDASAVMVGAVLEDSLRKLADENKIPTTSANGRPLTIDPINIALAKASVYGPLVQKQITTWADLRNSAAHGHYNNYDEHQVKQMLIFVQKFCADYLQ